MATMPLRVAVLGAGPIGIEAALYSLSLGYATQLFEQGQQPAEYLHRWGFVKMFTPFGMNISPLGKQTLRHEQPRREFPADTDLLSGREYREAYLVPLLETPRLKPCLRLQSTVLSIGRTGWRKSDPGDPRRPLPPFRLLLREANNVERYETADVILDCTGTYGRPNWVGDGGIPAAGELAARAQVAYWLEDVRGARQAHYAGKSIMVIGSGYSAATTVCELAALAEQQQSTWVIWLTHGARSQPLPRVANDPFKERDRLAARANHLALRCDGNLEYHAQTQIDELIGHGQDKGFRVAARIGGKLMSWEVERVIANVGYRPDLSYCTELRIDEPCGQTATGEPGYFILGARSRGRDSSFLIHQGREQIRQVFAQLQGQSRLDLYARAG